MGDRNDEAFGYAEFGKWYDAYRVAVLEPGLDRAMDALQLELNDSLSDRDLARIRSVSGRVKSKRRTWRKVHQQRYKGQFVSVDDIPEIIDDLVGIRLTCTNLRDLEMVQAALENLPLSASKRRPLSIDLASERDYVDAPKESGYRGWHVNLGVALEGLPVTIELQVRTLLQDSWGELTHEDTYSKAGELPPLVEVLSARMADLLATLDDIAEDLRNELDRIDEAIVAEPAAVIGTDVIESGAETLTSGPGADAVDLVVERWRALDRPLELSSLAWALQNEFGAEVSDDWFGFRTFKRFLNYAVPDGEITGGPQAYLLPPNGSDAVSEFPGNASESSSETVDSIVPDEAQELRRIDRGFPLIETEQWHQIYAQLAEAWRRHGGGPSSTRMLNQITRSARDRAGAAGEPLSRRHLDHVAKTVFAASGAENPLPAEETGDVFAAAVLQRMAELRIVDVHNAARRTVIARWLLG